VILSFGKANPILHVWLPSKKSGRNTIHGGEMLNKDFKEFIELLNNNHVRYLIGGGYAEAFHGYPRYTKDMDVWIDASLKNAERIIVSLEQFGFGSLGLLVEDFLEPDKIIQLGNPPLRIDLMTSVPGVEFESCYNSRIVLDLEGVIVNFIDLENLKKNKKASGRFQDLTDIENLDG